MRPDSKNKKAGLDAYWQSLKDQWKSFNPNGPFSFNFIDDRFAAEYKAKNEPERYFLCLR